MFKESFGDRSGYVMHGDTIETEVDGYTINAKVWPDNDSSPHEYDCFDPDNERDAEIIRLWEEGEWLYVGIVVSVSKADIVLDAHAASLWGIEANFPREEGGYDNSYLNEVAEDLLDEALQAGRDAVDRLNAA